MDNIIPKDNSEERNSCFIHMASADETREIFNLSNNFTRSANFVVSEPSIY